MRSRIIGTVSIARHLSPSFANNGSSGSIGSYLSDGLNLLPC